MAANYAGLGLAYSSMQQPDSAIANYLKAIELSIHTGDEFGGLMAKYNMGKAHTLAGNYTTAKTLLSEVLEFCENNGIVEGQIRSLILLGENERLHGNYSEAENYLNQTLALINTKQHPKLKGEEANKNDLWSKTKTQEIIQQAEAYGKLISTIHEIRNGLNDFKMKFRTRKDTEAFDRILKQIDKANGLNPLSDLLNAFKDLHPEFYAALLERNPELSPRELEMCALINLNMTSKQISVLLNITIKSIEVARHRIRKKMNPHPNQN